jgi:hypothetical protein
MDQEILHKLTEFLPVPLQRECEVVYLFVEIRKYLEHVFPDRTEAREALPVLVMFSDWVVHTKLTGYGKGSMLEKLDDALIAEQPSIDSSLKDVFDILAFKPLRVELGRFLSIYGLPTNLVDEAAQWTALVRLYLGVVSECPLVFTPRYPPKHMKSATLKLHELPDDLGLDKLLCVAYEWKFELMNGKTKSRFVSQSVSP